MPSRRLTKDEAAQADLILAHTKASIAGAAADDPILLFALRRRVFSRLMHWERGTPAERTKLKALKWQSQNGLCAMCQNPMEQKGSELDRADPVLGYTFDNTQLVHHACHRADQDAKRFL